MTDRANVHLDGRKDEKTDVEDKEDVQQLHAAFAKDLAKAWTWCGQPVG